MPFINLMGSRLTWKITPVKMEAARQIWMGLKPCFFFHYEDQKEERDKDAVYKKMALCRHVFRTAIALYLENRGQEISHSYKAGLIFSPASHNSQLE